MASPNTITSYEDVVTWTNIADYIYASVLNFDVGFYKPYGVFAFRPGGLRELLTKPPIYTLIRPWFDRGSGWERFNTSWSTQLSDYEGEAGEAWDTTTVFGWNHEFDIQAPAGADVRIKNYVTLFKNHNQFKFISKITPYVDLDNIGIEYAHFIDASYASNITKVYVEKEDGSFIYLPLAQVKNIKTDIPESVMKMGLVYDAPGMPDRLLAIFDETRMKWDTNRLQTEQRTVEGTLYWVCSIGGANVGTPQPVSAFEEVIF